jgi:hypothetical protein
VPATQIVFFAREHGTVPFLEWFAGLSPKAQDKCRVRLERLAELGHELRRPEADYLRDGIYELRVAFQGVNYRMLYFFHGREIVVISHGSVKERVVPPKEIEQAIRNKRTFQLDPEKHSAQDEV